MAIWIKSCGSHFYLFALYTLEREKRSWEMSTYWMLVPMMKKERGKENNYHTPVMACSFSLEWPVHHLPLLLLSNISLLSSSSVSFLSPSFPPSLCLDLFHKSTISYLCTSSTYPTRMRSFVISLRYVAASIFQRASESTPTSQLSIAYRKKWTAKRLENKGDTIR